MDLVQQLPGIPSTCMGLGLQALHLSRLLSFTPTPVSKPTAGLLPSLVFMLPGNVTYRAVSSFSGLTSFGLSGTPSRARSLGFASWICGSKVPSRIGFDCRRKKLGVCVHVIAGPGGTWGRGPLLWSDNFESINTAGKLWTFRKCKAAPGKILASLSDEYGCEKSEERNPWRGKRTNPSKPANTAGGSAKLTEQTSSRSQRGGNKGEFCSHNSQEEQRRTQGDFLKGAQVRIRVKGTFNNFGAELQGARSAKTKSSSSHSRHFGSRTFISGNISTASVVLQETVAERVWVEQQEEEMPNGRDRKRLSPSMNHGHREPKLKKKKYPPESELRRALDMCSKHANVEQALELYDKVVAEGAIKFNQYNYNVLLYLCASGALNALKPFKSGNEHQPGNRLGNQAPDSQELIDGEAFTESKAEEVGEAGGEGSTNGDTIILTDEMQKLCMKRGFEIYETMKGQAVPPNEATFTAVARLAVAKGDGDLAFEMVKQMAAAKLTPRLRSYGPALFTYCKNNIVDKAFEVDKHMQEAGIRPEETELQSLLELSVNACLEDKVYSLLHRLRTNVRELSLSTVRVIEQWFKSKAASIAGTENWKQLPEEELVRAAMQKTGGGWHGLGWLQKGMWQVIRTQLDEKGICRSCGEQLVTIDIDPRETEMFAESLSTLACQREAKNNEFKKFQEWLDRHGPYDAIVDGANVGLYNQNYGDHSFSFQQLSTVANGIQHRSPIKKSPLIILHHRRTKGGPAASPYAMKLLDKWHQADTIYTTPTGSNDDWYWLYAAVKYKCLLVTNDEMRDHLFQLLGTEFFPKWKERHQVRFTMTREGLQLHMPPPYSIVIQESEGGSWHIPKCGGDDITTPREWLCVTRPGDLEDTAIETPETIPLDIDMSGPSVCGESKPALSTSIAPLASSLTDQATSPDMSPSLSPLPKSPPMLQNGEAVDNAITENPGTTPLSSSLASPAVEDQPTSPRPSPRKRSPKSPSTPQKTKAAGKARIETPALTPLSPPVAVPADEDRPSSPKKSPRKPRSPKPSATLQKIKAAEKASTEKSIDFHI